MEFGETVGQKPPANDSLSEAVHYDHQSKDLLVAGVGSEGEISEVRHPFQEFLYTLRAEEIEVSTAEWLDLQQVLAAGKVENLDDLYFVSRALLVKDVTDYPAFDDVFGRLFFDLKPPKEVGSAGGLIEEEWDDFDEEEVPEEEEKAPIDSREVVMPGKTEEHHGGEDVHRDIQESPSKAQDQGKQVKPGQKKGSGAGVGTVGKRKKSQGQSEGGQGSGLAEELETKERESEGVDGQSKFKERKKKCPSAREIITQRTHESFRPTEKLSRGQIGRALSMLKTIVSESTESLSRSINIQSTVRSIAENAGLPEIVWHREREDNPKVILMFDVGGSTDQYRPIMEKLFGAARDVFSSLEIFYFHNAIYGEVWPQKDGNWGQNFMPVEKILMKDRQTKVIIIGDAWMAQSELWGSYDKSQDTGMDCFKRMSHHFDHVVWLNPIFSQEQESWDDSGTITDIRKVFPMFDLNLRGIEAAVRELMER